VTLNILYLWQLINTESHVLGSAVRGTDRFSMLIDVLHAKKDIIEPIKTLFMTQVKTMNLSSFNKNLIIILAC
jgi:hypothetical protein